MTEPATTLAAPEEVAIARQAVDQWRRSKRRLRAVRR